MPFGKKSLSLEAGQGAVSKWRGICVSLAASLLVAGCAQSGVQLQPAGLNAPKKAAGQGGNYKQQRNRAQTYYSQAAFSNRLTERRCLERAMFFESNRSSREGLMAVGTVVMNRVRSSQYPNTICAVVGQKNQFAPGVLARPMNIQAMPDVAAAAEAVLRGARSPKLKNAMYFHTAGMSFPYKNMHYVLVAGGNSFYERRRRDGSLSNPVNDETYDVAYAFAQDRGEVAPASAALDGAVRDATDNIKLASIHLDPKARLLQTAYRPVGAHETIAAAANASLNTVYDSRNVTEQSRANEAVAAMASYTPDSVPVPLLKANFREEGAGNARAAENMQSAKGTRHAARAPHFMPISAPDTETGAISEVAGAAGGAMHSFSYKAPDEQKAGGIGALLSGQ